MRFYAAGLHGGPPEWQRCGPLLFRGPARGLAWGMSEGKIPVPSEPSGTLAWNTQAVSPTFTGLTPFKRAPQRPVPACGVTLTHFCGRSLPMSLAHFPFVLVFPARRGVVPYWRLRRGLGFALRGSAFRGGGLLLRAAVVCCERERQFYISDRAWRWPWAADPALTERPPKLSPLRERGERA